MKYLKNKISSLEFLQLFFISLIPVFTIFIIEAIRDQKQIYKFIFGIVLACLTFFLSYLHDCLLIKRNNYLKGLKGQEYIEKILNRTTDKKYKIISSLMSDNGDIDFVVIGRNGIFCIEVKNISGTITYDDVNGNLLINNKIGKKDFLNQVQKNAFNLRNYISENIINIQFVKPILVFSGFSVNIKTQEEVDRSYVIYTYQLLHFLNKNLNYSLSEIEVENIYNKLSKIKKI